MKRLLRSFSRRQLEFSIVPILIILGLNAGLPPRTSLRFLHPKHLPLVDPTLHLESIPPKFLYLSYVSPDTGLCLKGKDDAYLLVFWLLAWTALRESLMRYVWRPLARWLGAPDKRSVERFAEQGWSVAYYLCSWTAGMYILYNSDYWTLQAQDIFGGYPHFSLQPFVKFYYLVQIAFWLQQIIVLNIEARRNDYYQMLAHHCVTIFLVVTSYSTNFTRVGVAILATMDLSDILLSLAKMLKYVGYQQICDVVFGLFVLSWIVTRHGIFNWLIYVATSGSRQVIGTWRWDPSAGWFWSRSIWFAYAAGLSSLQVLLCIWGFAIARLTIRVLRGQEASDTRSDDEDDDSVDEEPVHNHAQNGGPVKASGMQSREELHADTARRRK